LQPKGIREKLVLWPMWWKMDGLEQGNAERNRSKQNWIRPIRKLSGSKVNLRKPRQLHPQVGMGRLSLKPRRVTDAPGLLGTAVGSALHR
jgi:hypothetical protein